MWWLSSSSSSKPTRKKISACCCRWYPGRGTGRRVSTPVFLLLPPPQTEIWRVTPQSRSCVRICRSDDPRGSELWAPWNQPEWSGILGCCIVCDWRHHPQIFSRRQIMMMLYMSKPNPMILLYVPRDIEAADPKEFTATCNAEGENENRRSVVCPRPKTSSFRTGWVPRQTRHPTERWARSVVRVERTILVCTTLDKAVNRI